MIESLKKNLYKIILAIFIFAWPIVSLAQVTGDAPIDSSAKIVNPIRAETINELIKTILEGVIKIGIPVIVLAVIYSGFLFVSAQGNPEAIKKAKDALLYTLIGATVLLGSWAIAQLISDTVIAL